MTLDKHRVPGSVDKHLPDIRSASLQTDEGTITNLEGTDLQYEQVGITKATQASGHTFGVFERDGDYIAIDSNGNPQYTDSTGDLTGLLQSIVDNETTDVSTFGNYNVLTILLESQTAEYTASTQLNLLNGTIATLRSTGNASATIKWEGVDDDHIIHYDGTTGYNLQTAQTPYVYNNLYLSGIKFKYADADTRSADLVYLEGVNGGRISDLEFWFTDLDLSDQVKGGEDVATVVGGDWFALKDDTGYGDRITFENLWTVGSARGFQFKSDHTYAANIEAFYCNPYAGRGVIQLGIGGNKYNEMGLYNAHVYASSGNGVDIDGTAGTGPFNIVGLAYEDEPPNDYGSQEPAINNIGDCNVNVMGLRNTSTAGNYAGSTGSITAIGVEGGTNKWPTQDLSASGAPAPTVEGVEAYHTGTNPGKYRSDPGNNQWVKVEDNTITIAY